MAAPRPGLAAHQSGVFVLRPDGSDARRTSSAIARNVTWSPDDPQVLVGSDVTTLIDVTTGVAVELATGALEPTFAPDGETVLYRSDDESDWNIDAVDLDGGNRTRLTNNRGDDLTFTVSPLVRGTR